MNYDTKNMSFEGFQALNKSLRPDFGRVPMFPSSPPPPLAVEKEEKEEEDEDKVVDIPSNKRARHWINGTVNFEEEDTSLWHSKEKDQVKEDENKPEKKKAGRPKKKTKVQPAQLAMARVTKHPEPVAEIAVDDNGPKYALHTDRWAKNKAIEKIAEEANAKARSNRISVINHWCASRPVLFTTHEQVLDGLRFVNEHVDCYDLLDDVLGRLAKAPLGAYCGPPRCFEGLAPGWIGASGSSCVHVANILIKMGESLNYVREKE